ncbi:MAG: tetratricopeptide repeat protein [Deltaproteobacteria bacterium]|nr:tetratricopeptide repeat protein [Deltaproteobacteria bacterium]
MTLRNRAALAAPLAAALLAVQPLAWAQGEAPAEAPGGGAAAATSPRTPAEAELLFRRANDTFLSGAPAEAARLYTLLVEAGFGSADVHYNLGTAALKAGDLGVAVLAFERALRADPGHEDARANLEAALERNVDEVVGADEGPPFFERLARRLPVAPIAWGFAGAWVLLFGGLLLRRLQRLRGLATTAAVLGGVASLLLGAALADLYWYRETVHRAVVTAPAVSVRKGPAPRFETAFEIHQGLVVRALEADGPYLRVQLANGLEGWVRRTDVEPIGRAGLHSP